MSKSKKRIVRIILLFLISTFLSTFIITIKVGNVSTIIYQHVFEKELHETTINKQDIEVTGYDIDENQFTSITGDPNFSLVFPAMKVSNIIIYFSEPLKKDINVQVYYDNGKVNYNDDDSLLITADKNSSSLKIDLYKKNVTNIRIDLGDQKGIKFDLERVVLNKQNSVGVLKNVAASLDNASFERAFVEWEFLWLIIIYLGAHFIFDVKAMYQWIFKNRWPIAGIFLVFLVANKLHGDSIAIYDRIIQSGEGSELVSPIFGEPRDIRSDEFLVDTPSKLASVHDGNFDKYNYILRGTKTLNSVNGIYLGYTTLGRAPFQYIFAVLDPEYAFSFCWYAPIILSFLVAIELMLIISKKNRLVSVMGACLLIFSSYYMWWGFPSFLLGAHGALVCTFHFIQTTKKRYKVLFGAGVALSFSYYVLTLYPAWIVPMGFVVLCFLTWMIRDNWERIKSFKKLDWIIIVASIVLSISLIASYFQMNIEYITAIMDTAYPGKRSSSGGLSLPKLFYYGQSFLYAFKDIVNASEAAVILSLFPIPVLMVLFCWLKEKKKDWLTGGLLLVSIPFLLYVTVGLPDFISKLTLLNFTTPDRLIDIIGIMQIYFIVILLTKYENTKKLTSGMGVTCSILVAGTCMYISISDFPKYLSLGWICIVIIFIVLLGTGLMIDTTKKIRESLCYCLIIISISSSLYIRPVSKGLDAINSKPVANEISSILQNDKTSKWIAYGDAISLFLSGYLVACGAPTINSTNTYPNLELWHKLDSGNKYEDIYNRYAHIALNFTDKETMFQGKKETNNYDLIKLKLSYKDLEKTGAKYILSLEELDSKSEVVDFDLIYKEAGCYIYEVDYS